MRRGVGKRGLRTRSDFFGGELTRGMPVMAKNSWFKIEGKADPKGKGPKEARVDILGPIGGWDVSGSEFLRELKDLGEVEQIDLRIHSPGGSVLDGWAIANGLKNHPAHVTARVEGMAASMGSVIAMAADELEVPENAYLMIHNVTGGGFGEADDLESMANLMRKLQDDVRDFYANRTGLMPETVAEMMADETWLNGKEAVDLGFADRVLEPVKVSACVDEETLMAKFKKMPEGIFNEGEEEEPFEEEEGEKPVEEEEKEEPEAEEKKPSALTRILAALSGGKCAKDDGKLSAAAALSRIESLEAKVLAGETELELVQNELGKVTAEKQELEKMALTVEGKLAEFGFGFAEAADLPNPSKVDTRNALEIYLGMSPGAERREFFAENRKEIERLQRGE